MRRPKDMQLKHLIEIGVWELGQMVTRGELNPKMAWVALKGAAEYFKAAAEGDIAFEPVQRERLETCQKCPISQVTKGNTAPGPTRWCGTRFKDQTDKGKGCGCLLGVTVDGEEYPAGKTVVSSERCPLDKWTA